MLAALASLGYERVEQVRERGEFAVRGGIVDVYPSTGDPLRVEFWGDTVESLRRFSVFSQRAVAEVERCLVTTATEVDPTGDDVQAAVSQELASWELAGRDEAPDDAYRRAETRALARLSERFVDLAALCEERALRLASVGPDDVVRALAELRRRAVDRPARRRCASASTCRCSRCAACWPTPSRSSSCSASSACSSTPPGRRRPGATSPPPSATCAASPTTATASSSSSATPARPAAPAIA